MCMYKSLNWYYNKVGQGKRFSKMFIDKNFYKIILVIKLKFVDLKCLFDEWFCLNLYKKIPNYQKLVYNQIKEFVIWTFIKAKELMITNLFMIILKIIFQ